MVAMFEDRARVKRVIRLSLREFRTYEADIIRSVLFILLKLIDLHKDRLGYLIRRGISSSTGRANVPKIGL